MEPNSGNDLKQQVLSAIRSGQIKQRGRWYFILLAAAWLLAAAAVFFSLLFLVSFVLFTLKQNQLWLAPAFGPRGWGHFLWQMPWLVIVCTLALLLVLEHLVRRHQFAYRKPLLLTLLGLAAATTLAGTALSKARLHEWLQERTRQGRLPLAERLYGQNKIGCRSLAVGLWAESLPDGFIMLSRGEEVNVAVSRQTRLPDGYKFEPGQRLVTFGQCREGRLQASEVRKTGPGARLWRGLKRLVP